MKRITGILLVTLMVCGLFAGCGKSNGSTTVVNKDDNEKQVTIVMALPFAEQKDAGKVLEAINKELETLLPNTKLEILYDASMAEKWSLWMSTKKPIDIAHSGFATDIESEVNKKSYLALDGYVEEYGTNIQKLQKEYWYSYDTGRVGDALYAIPNIQYHVKETTELRIFAEAVPYIDTAALKASAWASDKTTKDFYDTLIQGIEAAEAAGVDCSASFNLELINIAKRGYTFIGGLDSNFCYDNSDSGEIINFYETQEFADFCTFMKTGAEKGWVSKDILTGQWTDKFHSGTTTRFGMDEETGIIQNRKDITVVLDDPSKDVIKSEIGKNGTYWSIPYTSANPGRAMKFIDLLNSEEGNTISNLLAYGIEGTHYEFTDKENGNIHCYEYIGQGSASNSYGIPDWMVCNMMLGMYNIEPYSHKNKEYGKEYYLKHVEEAKKHVLYGISFDFSAIRTDLNKIIKNNSEYAESIYSGIVNNSEQMLKELTEKNNSAGYEKVLNELQKQADAYIKQK